MNYSFSCEIHFMFKIKKKSVFFQKKKPTEEITYWNGPGVQTTTKINLGWRLEHCTEATTFNRLPTLNISLA